MPFPFSCTVVDELAEPTDPLTGEELVGCVRDWLEGEGAEFGEAAPASVAFTVPFAVSDCFRLRPPTLLPFDRGQVGLIAQAGSRRVAVHFSTKRFCGLAAPPAAGLGAVVVAHGAVAAGIVLAVAGWLLAFGLHYLIGFARAGDQLTAVAAEARARTGATPPRAV